MKYLALFAFSFVLANPEIPTRQSGKILGKGDEKPKIELKFPRGGWTVDRMLEIQGKVSDPTIDPIVVNINGDKYLLRTFSGAFQRKFPVSSGKNSIIVQATNKWGTVREERTVYAQVPTVAILAILTSDTNGVYTDLHIYEPKANLKDPFKESENSVEHVFWADTSSSSGGKFYLNEQGGSFDQPGYGPYLYTHTSPPLGIYRIEANYWPGGDKAHTVGNLNLVLFGGTANEIKKNIKYPLAKPGDTVVLAWVKIEKQQKASVYIPAIDTKPAKNIWPEWIFAYKPKSDSYDY